MSNQVTSQTNIKKSIEEPKVPSHIELHDALFFVFDSMERSMLPFILLGDMAKSINDEGTPIFRAEKIEVGVVEGQLRDSCLSTLKSVVKQEIKQDVEFKDGEAYMTYKNVPIEIRVLKKEAPFTNPDKKIYYLEAFNLPNPFGEYWNNR